MSNLPTVNVTARVYDQSGKPIHKAVVTMRLTTVERYSGYIVPREVRAETDAAGKAVLAVWPNELGTESSEYRVHIKYPHNGCESSCFNGGSGSVSGYAVVPNHDCDLQDIMELSPYEQRGAGQVITSEVAMYAGQASAARDAAQSHAQSAQASIGQVNAAAEKAEAAKTSAQIAAELATAKAGEAGELVQRANERIVYFESEVTQRVETETNRLTTAATTVITESRNDALNQIEQRTTQSIMEVTSNAATLKADAVEAVTRAEARAVDALDKGVEDGLRQFHEEGELFKEDFEQLTERAESAAKKAGCASLSAQSHANRACECAKAAELRPKPPRLRRRAYWKPHGRPNSQRPAPRRLPLGLMPRRWRSPTVSTMPRTRPRLRRGPRQPRGRTPFPQRSPIRPLPWPVMRPCSPPKRLPNPPRHQRRMRIGRKSMSDVSRRRSNRPPSTSLRRRL